MARAGLGPSWTCRFANDFDPKKAMTYQANWGVGGELRIGDIATLDPSDLPGQADLAWASFPCQDLSLAGVGAGLKGHRSGTFFPFWDLINGLILDQRPPKIIALENVTGALTSHNGQDFQVICSKYREAGYRVGALVINAEAFLPQSRPRLFVIGVHENVMVDLSLLAPEPIEPFHTTSLKRAVAKLPEEYKQDLLWWNVPAPSRRNTTFADLIEEKPTSVDWHTQAETDRLLSLMSAKNLAKVNAARRAGRRMVGGVYRRTRPDPDGRRVQRAEVRFDDIAGCLRTPAGGSSRQTIMIVDGQDTRSRLISARETARLMGLDDSYRLPKKYNEAYHLTGDGVVVPVVRHIAHHLLEPLLGVTSVNSDTCLRQSLR